MGVTCHQHATEPWIRQGVCAIAAVRVPASEMRILRYLLLLVAAVVALVAPSSAAAHASLAGSTPGKGDVLDAAPSEVQLEFSGTVVAGPGSIKVFAPAGDLVQTGAPTPAKGSTLRQSFASDETGTFGVSYSVSSEDGHVIKGSFTFSVGEKSSGGGADASKEAASPNRGLQIAFSTARFIEIVALLAAAGGGLFACLVAPGWRPRLLLTSLVVLLLSYVAGFILTTALLEGSIGAALNGDALRSTLDTPFGTSMEIRALVTFIAFGPALLLRSGPSLAPGARFALATVFVALAASLSTTGHAVTTEPTWLRMPLDMIHVVAASIWLGGLLQLASLAPYAATWIDSIVRFSRLAFGSVVVILVTGTYATYAELGASPGELVDSTYGRLVLAKLALYLGTMPLAWNNMSAFVPQVRRRPEDAPRMLRQYVWRELAFVIVVIALTVWLIATPQPT